MRSGSIRERFFEDRGVNQVFEIERGESANLASVCADLSPAGKNTHFSRRALAKSPAEGARGRRRELARDVLEGSIVRTTCAATLFIALFAAPALAEPLASNEAPVPPETFRYTTPAEPNPLRATLELGGVLVLGFAWYATTSTDIVHQWDVNYDFATFRRKLTGQAFGADTNKFGTNFIGHPLGGTGYYLSARSNQLTILQSFGYSLAGSLLWELFGEVSEVVSLNDSLVTPVAGLAIGESTTQLGAFFDRSGPSSMNQTLGSVFGPFKSLNDALDGRELVRAPSGFPDDEWHRFELSASAVGVF